MAIISKSEVAIVLGITDVDISQSVYDWGIKQFFVLTGLKDTEEQKTDRKFVNTATLFFKLKNTNIKTIDTLKIDNTDTDFTLFSDLKFNPDTGLVNYSGGFSGGQLIEITYTLNAYSHTDVHDYLVTLLIAKALSIFTPDKIQQIRMVKIGRFQKQFGSASANLNSYIDVVDAEIDNVINIINGDDGKFDVGNIL